MTKKFSATSLKSSLGVAQQKTQDRFEKADIVLAEPLQQIKTEKVFVNIQRQSLSVLKTEAEMAEQIVAELNEQGFNPSISEVYRAGLQVLAAMSLEERKKQILALERLKSGRPKKQ